MDVLARVEPELCRQKGQQNMRVRTEGLDADALPLEVCDATDAGLGEQLVAAGMNAGEQGNGCAGIDRCDKIRCIIHREVNLTTRQRGIVVRLFDVLDVSKPLGAQQCLG